MVFIRFLILSLFFLGFSISKEVKEIYITGYFECDFNKLERSEEGEKYIYFEGEVVKIDNSKVIITLEENGKFFYIILPDNCKDNKCLKVNDYVKIFMEPENKKACIKFMNMEG